MHFIKKKFISQYVLEWFLPISPSSNSGSGGVLKNTCILEGFDKLKLLYVQSSSAAQQVNDLALPLKQLRLLLGHSFIFWAWSFHMTCIQSKTFFFFYMLTTIVKTLKSLSTKILVIIQVYLFSSKTISLGLNIFITLCAKLSSIWWLWRIWKGQH